MKISNLKIILLLVLGAFTLTLPNTVRAEDKLSKEMQDWLDTNLRLGTVKEGNNAELLNKIDELDKKYKEYKDQYYGLKGEFTLALAKWGLKDRATLETERIEIQKAIQGVSEAKGFWDTVWETAKGGWNIVTTRARRQLSAEWEYIEGWFTFDKGDTAEAFLALVKKHYRSDSELMSIAQKMVDVGKKAYEIYLQRQIYSENEGGKLYIYQEPGGSKIFFRQNGDTLLTVGGVTVGCIPMPAKLAESKSCIFCPLFKTIFKAAQDISTNAFTQLGKSMALVMLIGFSIYIAFSVLKLVSSFTKQDGPKFITGLLGQAFKVLFAYVMLMNSPEVYNYIIAPVLSAGLEFGMSLLFEKGNSYISSCPTTGDANLSGIIPTYLYVKLDCFIRAVQAEISLAQTIGSSLMCVARHASADSYKGLGVEVAKLWDFSMMFQGLIIYCFALLISLAFAFYLIDATVRLGIVGALMPFLIACWPFKITSSYTGKGWAMFMNSFFTYVMMGLVVSVNIQLIGASLTGGKGGFKAIEAALNGDQVSVLRDLLDIGFGGFLILIACCLFGFKLTGQATELANQMSGGGTSPIGSMIGGLAASGAKGAALGVGKKGLGAAAFVGEKTGVTPALRRGRDKVLGSVGRALGFGKNSGAAGGSKARAAAGGAAGGASTTAQSSNKPTSPNTTPTSPTPSSQAQQAQGAGPRNNGNNANQNQDNNGAADPVMNRRVQDTMKEADKNVHNYVGNKRDNDVAWDKYQKSEASLKQAKSDYENAQRMAKQAKGTPDEAKYAAAAEKAAQRYAGVQKSHSQNEQNVQDTQDKMNDSAVNAYVNQQKAIAQRNGKGFDENKSREYARTHLDEIKKNLDTIVKADPRYN